VMRGDRGFNPNVVLGGRSAGVFTENDEDKGNEILRSCWIFAQNCHIQIVCKMTFCMVFKISVALQDKSYDLFSSPTTIFICPGLAGYD
jgi:hypothetical protein